MKIALCLFGQPRSWNYCLPWLYECLGQETPGHELVTFCSTKDYLNYRSKLNVPETKVPDLNLLELRAFLLAKGMPEQGWSVRTKVLDELAWANKNTWHFASYFASLQDVHSMVKTHEAQHGVFDIVIVTRTDVILHPLQHPPHSVLERITTAHCPVEPHVLYSTEPNMRFFHEAYRMGVGDLFYYGDSLTIDLLVSGTMQATSGYTYERDYRYFWPKGPNIILNDIARQAGIDIQRFDAWATVVRPEHVHIGDPSDPLVFHEHHKKLKETHEL